MVKLMEESEIDTHADEMDAVLTAEEELAALRPVASGEKVADLTDGGMVGGARIRPMQNGKTLERGRAAARLVWMWNGTESTIPLAWNPDGTVHDGGRRFLLKRHCLCCGASGFKGYQCPTCVKNNCAQCHVSTDRTKVHHLESGKTIQGWIIPCFYLRKDDVPYQTRFYGNVNCFLEGCPRRGARGFKTEQDMRMHASTRHRMEYRAHQEAITASQTTEVDSMRRQLDALIAKQLATPVEPVRVVPQSDHGQVLKDRMAKARAARRHKAVTTTPAMA